VRIPDDAVILIVHSGIERGLVDGEYNARRAQCEDAARMLGIRALRDADMAQLESARHRMEDVTYRRARHVITENARTLAAAKALENDDLECLGTLMAQSHHSMRDDFEITLPQIDHLVEVLHEAIGQHGGARMTGGGFGGAVVAVMAKDDLDAAQRAVRQKYRPPSGDEPFMLIETASKGASLL
jgi:galactokinase